MLDRTIEINGNLIDSESSPFIIAEVGSNFNQNLEIEGILLTMVDKRNSLSSLVENDVRTHFSKKVYKTTIPRNVRISEAPSHGLPAIIYDLKCSGSQAYIALAKEFLERSSFNGSQ